MTKYYHTLGVPQTATKEQIKKAYRQLSLRYHPDMPTGNESKYLEIKEAYDYLIKFDPTQAHCQYQHRKEPYIRFDFADTFSDGVGFISASFSNILYVESAGVLAGKYFWDTFKYTDGSFKIQKKDLIACNFVLELRVMPVIGRSTIWSIAFVDKRSKWEKFWYNVRLILGL